MPQDKLGMLDASYTSGTKKLSERENPHLLKYIDEQLGNKKNDPDQEKSKRNTEVTALYVCRVCLCALQEHSTYLFCFCTVIDEISCCRVVVGIKNDD